MAMRVYNEVLKEIEQNLGTTGETTSSQLERLGRKMLGSRFSGVYAADDDIKITKEKPFAVVNGGKRAGGGFHWFGAYRLPDNSILCSDSFGRPIKKFTEDYRALTHGGRFRIRNTDRRPEQRASQNNCGQRSLAWLWVVHTMGAKAASTI